MTPIPNPGSEEAVAMGCSCPIIDNHYGEGIRYSAVPCFWINADCLLHGFYNLQGGKK